MFLFTYLKSLIQSILQSLGLNQKQGTILLLGLDNAGKTTLLHKLRTNTIHTTFTPTERPHQETFYVENIKFVGWDLGGHEAVRHLWEDYVMIDNIDAILFMVDACDGKRLEEVYEELDSLVYDSILKRQHYHHNTNSNSHSNGNGNGNLEDVDEEVVRLPPLAILLNKCDLEDAQSSHDIAEGIGYTNILDGYTKYCSRISTTTSSSTLNEEEDDDDENENHHDSDDHDNDNTNNNDNMNGNEMVKLFRISVWRGEGYQDAFKWIATFL